MASIPVSQYPPAAMIALLSRSTNQSRSPKKRKLPSSSPAPQSIPEPFDHGQQAPEFQRVRILQGSEKESRSQDAHPAATTKSHQITARSSGTLEWPCPPIFQVAVRTSKPREAERFLLGARVAARVGWPWWWCRQQFLRCASAKASPFRCRAQFFWLL